MIPETWNTLNTIFLSHPASPRIVLYKSDKIIVNVSIWRAVLTARISNLSIGGLGYLRVSSHEAPYVVHYPTDFQKTLRTRFLHILFDIALAGLISQPEIPRDANPKRSTHSPQLLRIQSVLCCHLLPVVRTRARVVGFISSFVHNARDNVRVGPILALAEHWSIFFKTLYLYTLSNSPFQLEVNISANDGTKT